MKKLFAHLIGSQNQNKGGTSNTKQIASSYNKACKACKRASR
jgi:hypothetical protein|nr:MAG TPA: Myogenic Basic domain [Caudoviricetes sp.]